MNIEKRILPVGTMKRPGTKLTRIQGVTIHNTGNYSRGSGADAHANYCHNSCNSAYDSYHYVVDDKKAIQLIPEDEVSWHAGDGATGPGNTTTISIEICVNPDSNLAKATDNAAQLAAQILNRHGVELLFQHWHWTGKNCPAEIRAGRPYSWDKFVDKVTAYQKKGGGAAASKPANPTPTKPKPAKPAEKTINGVKTRCDQILTKGSKVTSGPLAIMAGVRKFPDGNYIRIPALGDGWFPMTFISEHTSTKDGKCDGYLANDKAIVYLDRTTVEAIDIPNQKVKIHGLWVYSDPLVEISEGK